MAATIEDRLFDVITSMYTACPVVLEEPSIMAAGRIVKWAEQLIAVLEDFGLSDEFLSAARTATLDNITSMFADPERFGPWLDEITVEFVGEARRRNIAAAVQPSSDS